MRSKIRLIISLVVLISLVVGGLEAASTQSEQGSSSVAVNKSVTAEMKHLTKTIAAPKTAAPDAIPAEIEILYPELSSPEKSNTGIQAINKGIQEHLLTLLDERQDSIEALVKAFSKEYEEAMNQAPELTGGWNLKFKASVKYSDEDLIALEILESISTGGAHGDSKITNLVFSLKTGEPISLKDFVPEEKMSELNRVGEKVFRQAQQIKPSETYEQAGFDFEKQRFSLNQNFLVSKTGLAFCYNHYEIAPYSKGIIELVIPWDELKTIAQPNGLSGRFLSH